MKTNCNTLTTSECVLLISSINYLAIWHISCGWVCYGWFIQRVYFSVFFFFLSLSFLKKACEESPKIHEIMLSLCWKGFHVLTSLWTLSLHRCSILACSAYVALALGDNLMALNHAEKLLHQTKLSGSLKWVCGSSSGWFTSFMGNALVTLTTFSKYLPS